MATADTVRDRRQARDERGVRSTASLKGSGGGDRLPSPPRERKPALAALAVLLIVGGAAVAGLLAMRMDERVPVVVAADAIPVGTEITESMLSTEPVASGLETLIPESQIDQLIGLRTTRDINPGELLTPYVVTDTGGWLRDGLVAVGAQLPPGRVPPPGLEPGDVVTLVQVTDGAGQVLVEGVRVGDVGTDERTGETLATFVVGPDVAPSIAAVAADGSLAVVIVSRDEPLEDGD